MVDSCAFANNSKTTYNFKNFKERKSLEKRSKIKTSTSDLVSGVTQKNCKGLKVLPFQETNFLPIYPLQLFSEPACINYITTHSSNSCCWCMFQWRHYLQRKWHSTVKPPSRNSCWNPPNFKHADTGPLLSFTSQRIPSRLLSAKSPHTHTHKTKRFRRHVYQLEMDCIEIYMCCCCCCGLEKSFCGNFFDQKLIEWCFSLV